MSTVITLEPVTPPGIIGVARVECHLFEVTLRVSGPHTFHSGASSRIFFTQAMRRGFLWWFSLSESSPKS